MFTKKAYLVQAKTRNDKVVTFVQYAWDKQDACKACYTDSRIKKVLSVTKTDQPTTSIENELVSV